ncbi:MAG: HNH endonuclease [Geodermatophilaceae bacterium]|nr:HNH endonuclease [Geodermatophilaceae bacterium]MDQ3454117.1 HNH endonuclease [Actinomycetota bacterium]
MILRDKGCAFPGCDRPYEWCDGHHILGHARGGGTALGNGVLLCGVHHHVVHNDGWEIVIADDGVPEFIPPPTVDPSRTPRRNHRHE